MKELLLPEQDRGSSNLTPINLCKRKNVAFKQQLELDMELQAGSKSGKEYGKAVYCHIYMSMRNASLDEALAGIKIDGRNYQ